MSRWLVALTVMLPTLIEIIDTSIVNVSLDHIRGSLSAGIEESTWAITAYLVSNAIVIPMTGWLSKLFGRKRYLIFSISLFTASSFLCGAAWSLASLIFFRIVQGVGGGSLQPLSQSILLEEFPREKHGTAMAIFGMGAMFGPIIGPVLGGWITDHWNWRWIFYVNVPIGALSVLLAMIVISDPPYMQRVKMKIDYWGLAFLAVGLGSLQFVLDKGEMEDWFASGLITGFAVVAAVALVLFVLVELFSNQPVVDLTLFRDRTFTTGDVVMFFAFFNLFGGIVLLPIYLQNLLGYTAFLAGVVLGPGGLAAMAAMPVAGRLVEKVNPKWVLAVGVAVAALSTYLMSQFTLQSDFWSLVWPRALLGVGMGLLFIPLTTLTLSHIPKERMTDATSIYNLLRNIGGSCGVAFATTLLARRSQFHHVRLGAAVTPFDATYLEAKARISAYLSSHGLSGGADGVLYREFLRQVRMLAFNDAFFLLSVLMASVLPLLLIMKRGERRGPAPMH